MGLILDTDVLIAGERRGDTVSELLRGVQSRFGESEAALSVVTIAEMTHGIYRAGSERDRQRRSDFCRVLCDTLIVHPVSLEIATLAGRLEGEQAAKGIAIAFEDLLIGATALYLEYAVVTHNVKHFSLIPALTVLQV